MHCLPSQVSKKKKRAHACSFWRFGTTLSFLSLICTRSFGSLGSCKKNPKDKTHCLSPLHFGSFCLHDLNERNGQVESGLSASSLGIFV